MHASQGLFDNIFLPKYHCQVRNGVYLPYIKPAEADSVLVNCTNPLGTNIVTCRDQRIQSFLNEVDGLALNVSPSHTIHLHDRYIPIFDYRTIDLAYEVSSNIVGLTLVDILAIPPKIVAGHYTIKRIAFRDAAAIRRLCLHKKVVLFLTGRDVLIETIWHQRSSCELFQQLSLMGFWAVTGFNFSVFGGECPVAQHLNQKKSLISSMLIEENGLFTIPHVYAVNDFHITKYREWLKCNPHIHLLTMNCQMQRNTTDIEQIVRAVKALLIVNEELHIILQGFRFSEIHRLDGFLDRIHIAESKAVKYGQVFKSVDPTFITQPQQYAKNAYMDLVVKNVEFRNHRLQKILKGEFW
ncbi:hypothetical protein [Chitinophaga sp. OAE865]|uniref:hypothetical protein n=1 Tax=Chitinophaga sp. OAE865 TaxID=2817898 RepID=UPI001AE41DED